MGKADDGMTDAETIAANIRAHMDGRTQTYVANKVHVHRTLMGRYCRGESEPSAGNLKRIALALGCSVDELLEGVGE